MRKRSKKKGKQKMRTNYPSDITREQFENVRKDLKGVKKRILENMMFKISFVQYYI